MQFNRTKVGIQRAILQASAILMLIIAIILIVSTLWTGVPGFIIASITAIVSIIITLVSIGGLIYNRFVARKYKKYLNNYDKLLLWISPSYGLFVRINMKKIKS